MNRKIIDAAILTVLVVVFWAGFYFKNDITGVFNNAAKNLSYVNTTTISNTIQKITQEISNPAPLNIGGNPNNVVLSKNKIIIETNIQRHDNGNLPALIENTQLDNAALAKANDIFKNQYFEHVSPSGVDPGQLVKSFGYDYILAGENLILGNFGSEQEAVQDWMNSPGHRANILNNRFVNIGAAVVKGTYKGQTAWVGVQEFGLPISACPADPGNDVTDKITKNQNQLDALSSQLAVTKTQIDATDPSSPEYNTLVDQYNSLVNQYNQLNQTTKNMVAQYNAQVNNFNNCVEGK